MGPSRALKMGYHLMGVGFALAQLSISAIPIVCHPITTSSDLVEGL